jgi:RNA polymerase sigma-70 factor, ECF subfamily
VARAQLGDLHALDKVLATIQEPLFRHVRTILGDEQDAEDALQEILLTVSRKIGSVRDPRWFRAWAYRIATRDAVRFAKRRKRNVSIDESAELENILVGNETADPETDLIERLPEAVATLSPASQLVIRMHYNDGLSHTEIAEALELSVGTVKSRLAYGLAALRARIK